LNDIALSFRRSSMALATPIIPIFDLPRNPRVGVATES
jgi:hypothetical protein